MERALALYAAAGADAVIAAAYAYVGWLLAERPYAPDVRRAGRLFAAWWFGIAATGVLSAGMSLLASRGAAPGLVDAVDQATLVCFAAALVGFTAYVAFLLRGDHRALVPILVAYAALAAWSLASAVARPATGYHVEAWRPIVDRPAGSFGPPPALTAALLVVPVVGGTVAYASLYRRASDAAARYRILLVTCALVAWLAGVAIVSLPFLGASTQAQVGGRAVVVLSAALILLAYRPPRLVRAWMGEGSALLQRRERSARMAKRVRDLV